MNDALIAPVVGHTRTYTARTYTVTGTADPTGEARYTLQEQRDPNCDSDYAFTDMSVQGSLDEGWELNGNGVTILLTPHDPEKRLNEIRYLIAAGPRIGETEAAHQSRVKKLKREGAAWGIVRLYLREQAQHDPND